MQIIEGAAHEHEEPRGKKVSKMICNCNSLIIEVKVEVVRLSEGIERQLRPAASPTAKDGEPQ